MKINGLLAAAGSAAVIASAAADIVPTPTDPGAVPRITPTAIAGSRLTPDGRWERTTRWLPTGQGGAAVDPDTPIYASMEMDGYGENVCEPDAFYFLKDEQGAMLNIPMTVTNMRIPDEFRGGRCQRVDFLFYWTDGGPGSWYVSVFLADDVSMDCGLPAWEHQVSGITMSFAPLDTGYYFMSSDDIYFYWGLYWTMPEDGEGAWILKVHDEAGNEPPGPNQVASWGTANNGGSPGRPGTSTSPTWADMDASGGFDPDSECLPYRFGLCPDPLTTGIVFLSYPKPDCYADCDADGGLTFFDFLCFTNGFNAGHDSADCDGDGALNFFDFLCFTNVFNGGC